MNQNATGGGIGKGWEEPVMDRVPREVESQMSDLHKMNEELFSRCASLKKRLGSVLRAREKKEAPATPRPALVPLAEGLREIGDNMRNEIEMLEEIEMGVEL